MATVLLKTKLHIPPLQPALSPRPRLIEQLDVGLHSCPSRRAQSARRDLTEMVR
jgi:hypothetical protein